MKTSWMKISLFGSSVTILLAQEPAPANRLSTVMDGNQVRTLIYNYGSIGRPNTEPSLEWPAESGQGYAFEFGLLVGTRLDGENAEPIHFIADGLVVGGVAGSNPDGTRADWEPMPGYVADTEDATIARSDDPATWPSHWASWPGLSGWGELFADLESYYVMDDRFVGRHVDNYTAIADDSSYWGAGLQVGVRSYQWSSPALADVLLNVYEITNISDHSMDSVVVGMKGDPHIGGANDYSDDNVSMFDRQGVEVSLAERQPAIQNLIYAWDDNQRGGPEFGDDNVGLMGIHLMDQFDGLDIATLRVMQYTSSHITESHWWAIFKEDSIYPSQFTQRADNIVLFGTDFFPLTPGETRRLAIAFILGETKSDLFQNARNADVAFQNTFMPNANPPHAQIQSPVADEVVSNTVTVNYSITAGGAPVDLAKLYYTRNDSTGWFYIDEIDPGNGIYEWSTAVLPDGYNYQIGIQVFAGESWNFSVSPHFILNNPGPANPEILPFYPLFERELDSTVVLSWRAGDPDGDSVNTIIEYSTDNGNSWLNLTTNTASIFDWDTRQFPNSENYKLRWGVTQDDAVYYSGASVRFSVSNDFTSLPDSTIEHAEGNSTGQIIVSVIPEQSITGHPYEVTFTGQSNLTRYNVSDMVTHQPVIQNELLPLYPEQGSLFDGLRLSFVNPEPSLNQESSGWNEGNTTLTTDLRRFNNTTILPYDYELVFFDTPIDTPWNVSYGVNVKVWNTTLAKYEEMFLSDHHPRDGFIGPLDNLVPTDTDTAGNVFSLGWQVSFHAPSSGDTILPALGDTFTVITNKPFLSADTIHFNTEQFVTVQDKEGFSIPRSLLVYQNFPNPFNPTTTIRYTIPEKSQVTVTIYDPLGREVNTLVNGQQTAGDYALKWNGTDAVGRQLSSGLYFCQVQAGGFSESIKLVLLR